MNGNWNDLREPRQGVLLHYDGSRSDAGAVAWLTKDPRCRVSYHWLILDDGHSVLIAPPSKRAWHAGVCLPSIPQLTYKDANSAFYGIAIAATDGDRATQAQIAKVLELCRWCFLKEGWPLQETWRIRGHFEEAWPRGRKHDPKGSGPIPVLDVQLIRDKL